MYGVFTKIYYKTTQVKVNIYHKFGLSGYSSGSVTKGKQLSTRYHSTAVPACIKRLKRATGSGQICPAAHCPFSTSDTGDRRVLSGALWISQLDAELTETFAIGIIPRCLTIIPIITIYIIIYNQYNNYNQHNQMIPIVGINESYRIKYAHCYWFP